MIPRFIHWHIILFHLSLFNITKKAFVASESHVYRIQIESLETLDRLLKVLENYPEAEIWTESFHNGHLDVHLPATSLEVLEHVDHYSLLIGGVSQKLLQQHQIELKDQSNLLHGLQSIDNANQSQLFPLEQKKISSFVYFQDYQSSFIIHEFLSSFTSSASIGETFENRTIYGYKIGHGPNNIVFLGGIHAREWISPAVVAYLTYQLSNNPQVSTNLLNKYTFHMIPLLNVDGYEYSRINSSTRLWRKNRQILSSSGSNNCVGVDLNRNFPFQWDAEEVSGFSNRTKRPCADDYRGKEPGDAPEVNSQLWLYPFGYTCDEIFDSSRFSELGNLAIDAIKSNSSKNYATNDICNGLYAVSGSSTDFMHSIANTKFSFAVELRDQGKDAFLLPSSQIVETGNEMFEAIKAILSHDIEGYLVTSSSESSVVQFRFEFIVFMSIGLLIQFFMFVL